MFGRIKSSDSAVYNLASLLVLSAKDRLLTIEFKKVVPIGKFDDGTDADKAINDLMASLGEKEIVNSDLLVPHINDTPIPIGIFSDVMKCIGDIYMKDKSEMALRKL
jgi:hypothetical protein